MYLRERESEVGTLERGLEEAGDGLMGNGQWAMGKETFCGDWRLGTCRMGQKRYRLNTSAKRRRLNKLSDKTTTFFLCNIPDSPRGD